MRKLSVLLLLFAAVFLTYCSSSKKTQAAAAVPSKITYVTHVQPIVAGSCAPCHIPPQGNKKAYNSYAGVKTDIDEIITRIQKNPGERGFMPLKHPKLADSTILVFVNWKKDGLIEQ
jgi:mono/diheme cytochrome c family protein